MKPPRTALPLPRYVERKPISAGWAHYWHTPKWARDAGCPIGNEALGLDYGAAVKRAGKSCYRRSMPGDPATPRPRRRQPSPRLASS